MRLTNAGKPSLQRAEEPVGKLAALKAGVTKVAKTAGRAAFEVKDRVVKPVKADKLQKQIKHLISQVKAGKFDSKAALALGGKMKSKEASAALATLVVVLCAVTGGLGLGVAAIAATGIAEAGMVGGLAGTMLGVSIGATITEGT